MEKRNDFQVSFAGAKKARTGVLVLVVALGLTACGGSGTRNTATTPARADVAGSETSHHRHGYHGHRFNDAARWSKVFDDPARDEWQKPAHVVELMAITEGMAVADVGAGTGYFEPHLSRAVGSGGKVIAEDVEPDMVQWMADRAKREGLTNVHAILGKADDPKLPSSSLDRVLVVDTWHHIDDRRAFAQKLAGALKAGGSVFVVDFTFDSPHGPPKHARLAPEAIREDLAAAGLEVEIVKSALPDQYVVRGQKR
jgi:SAM-dependent methyltransferase